LVSSTVKDLVVGSGITSRERGEHKQRGVPDRWRLFAVVVDGPGGGSADPEPGEGVSPNAKVLPRVAALLGDLRAFVPVRVPGYPSLRPCNADSALVLRRTLGAAREYRSALRYLEGLETLPALDERAWGKPGLGQFARLRRLEDRRGHSDEVVGIQAGRTYGARS
jgi:hypothetical protein